MAIWANNRARIIVTGECNIECFYCHNEGQPKNQKKISDGLVNRISELMKLNPEKLESITFSGGEPLLHPKLFNYIEKLSQYSQRRTLVSNGLLLDKIKLENLINSGVTKIRLGVDSISKLKSRPTKGNSPSKPITDIIDLVMNSKVNFELNVVLSKYNSKELEDLIKYCEYNKISAKFFELVEVDELGDIGKDAILKSKEAIPYLKFKHIALSVLNTQRFSDDMGEANVIFEGEGFTLRYCHYLCDYGLCYKTGTRIDSDGSVYTCMKQRGKLWITNLEPLESSHQTMLKSNFNRCDKTKYNGV
jgi:cyclic pyranopterin phosphate synthase